MTEREKFEAWCRKNNGVTTRLKGTDQYFVLEVQAAWTAWQAKQAELDELNNRFSHLKKEVSELRDIKFIRFNQDECWIYQGDGNDNLETLVCPVVVKPSVLIELQAELDAANAKIAELTATPQVPEGWHAMLAAAPKEK